MLRYVYILFLIIATLGNFSSKADAEVYLSRQMSFSLPETKIHLLPGKVYGEPILSKNAGIEISVDLHISGIFTDVYALICDEENKELFLAQQPYRCYGGKSYRENYVLKGKTYSKSDHYLVVYNPFNPLKPFNDKVIKATIGYDYTLPYNVHNEAEAMLETLANSIYQTFEVPEFDIRIEPCGFENAFSAHHGGHITLCTEIMGQSLIYGKTGVLAGIFYHELGHTLLNLWGLPNWDNEKTADEFAVAMLLNSDNGNEKIVHEWISYFEDQIDTLSEAKTVAYTGDQHPLSVQRIAAIREILDNPYQVVRRWNKALYPHMKTQVLEDIASGKSQGFALDRELAKKILEERTN